MVENVQHRSGGCYKNILLTSLYPPVMMEYTNMVTHKLVVSSTAGGRRLAPTVSIIA